LALRNCNIALQDLISEASDSIVFEPHQELTLILVLDTKYCYVENSFSSNVTSRRKLGYSSGWGLFPNIGMLV